MNDEKLFPLVPFTNEIYDRAKRVRKFIISLSTQTAFNLTFDRLNNNTKPLLFTVYNRGKFTFNMNWIQIQNKAFLSLTDNNTQRRLQSVNSLIAAYNYYWSILQKMVLDYKKNIKYKIFPMKDIKIPDYKFDKGEMNI